MLTFHRTTESRRNSLPEQSSTGRVKLNRCLYIKATREKLTWGDSVRHYASEEELTQSASAGAAARLQGRGHTQTCQPILPQTQIPRCLLGLRPPLTEWVPKPINRQRAPKLCREPNMADSILQEVQRQVFSLLLTCFPMPTPAPALDTVSTT